MIHMLEMNAIKYITENSLLKSKLEHCYLEIHMLSSEGGEQTELSASIHQLSLLQQEKDKLYQERQ